MGIIWKIIKTNSIISIQYIIIKTNLSKSKANLFFYQNIGMYKYVHWIIDIFLTRFPLQIKYISQLRVIILLILKLKQEMPVWLLILLLAFERRIEYLFHILSQM